MENSIDLIRVKRVQYSGTVNSEIFARVLILRNFASAKFHKNKFLAKKAKPHCRFLM